MKKGFTLVELLAVIAILAILVIIALPNVLGMFQSAKKNTFTTELQNIYKSATTQYVSDSMNRGAGSQATGIFYTRTKGQSDGTTSCGSKAILDLSGTETIDYYIQFDLSGNVVKYAATDGEFVFFFDGSSSGSLAIEDIGSDVKVYTIADEQKNHSLTTPNPNYFTVHIEHFPKAAIKDGVCYRAATDDKPASYVDLEVWLYNQKPAMLE